MLSWHPDKEPDSDEYQDHSATVRSAPEKARHTRRVLVHQGHVVPREIPGRAEGYSHRPQPGETLDLPWWTDRVDRDP